MRVSMDAASQPQCQFFVQRKKRLCRMTVRPGRQYCGEHEPQPLAEDQETDKRVPCPNDPKHTCYASKLEKHLAKCNARQVPDPPYIVRNINDIEDDNLSPRVPLKDVPIETLQLVIEKVNTLYDKHVKDTISTYIPPAEHHPVVAACIAQADRTDSSRRHLRQASRLMQLAEDEGLVGGDTCYVELGAGKGMLSFYMGTAWCARAGRVLAVDRAPLRHKRDTRLAARRAARLRADLRHLALQRAPPVRAAAALVAVAKHLCGVATDYALRCVSARGALRRARGALLATCCHHRCERRAYAGGDALRDLGVTGDDLNIMFSIVSWATCGDGRSRERRLAGDKRDSSEDGHTDTEAKTSEQPSVPQHDADSHRSNSPEREDVETEKAVTTQAISSLETDRDIIKEKESNTNTSEQKLLTDSDAVRVSSQPLPINVREEIGRRAKALIDYGRVLYLREKGFEARLCYYVPTTESLENLCIVAKKDVL